MKAAIIIPARYASTRLPAKALADIAGLPMVVRCARGAAQSTLASQVVVATDDARIESACRLHNVTAVITRGDHASGTDRCAEAAVGLDAEWIVNVQGDEPCISGEIIDVLIRAMQASGAHAMGTLVHPLTRWEDFISPNTAKVVVNARSEAVYFSRSRIPYATREEFRAHAGAGRFWKHIGLYAFRRDFLLEYPHLPRGETEAQERLEQLRALEHGRAILVTPTTYEPLHVETAQDLERVRGLFTRADSPS